MPRYFIDTYGDAACLDADGHDLPDLDAARALMQRALAEMIHDARAGGTNRQVRAEVRDDRGRSILAGSLVMVVQDVGEPRVCDRTVLAPLMHVRAFVRRAGGTTSTQHPRSAE